MCRCCLWVSAWPVDTVGQINEPGSPGDSDGKDSAYYVGHMGLIPGWKDPVEKGMATHSSILA